MAVRQLPPWVGQSRGTAIGSLALLEPVAERTEGSFVERLGDRLMNAVGDSTAAVVGFMFVLNALVALSIIAASISPVLGALMVLIAVGWVVVVSIAGLAVHAHGDDASAWARYLLAALTVVGRITVVVMTIVTLIVLLYFVLAIVAAGRNG
jgi:hypothetical protein